ncbi:MalY/PatB family protein [Rhodococcus sp. IEGM 1379]|uniref:MalY/PatB family protein n=1 Tax=Rhodococcus sp. IEGM 1379 TaxID=3047086 RepID=UPI0024B7F2B2|nr:MalY/PatB family protein [Rhodococcus sp. IEGM 1379]MDI9914188.1 MalY/PatB family protein [Rhodococcus sp. IEGM 1379]
MSTSGSEHPFDRLSIEDLRRRSSLKWTAHPEDVLPLWIAEMDFPTAEPVVEALRNAVEHEEFGYAPRGQSTDLPAAVADWQSRHYGWTVDPARVHILPDVVHSIGVAIETFSPAGSGVVIPTPAYMPFFALAHNLERPVMEAPMLGHGLDASLNLPAVEAAFARGAKTLILCQPHNPIGRVFRRDELTALSAIVDSYGARVVSDEIHSPLVFPGAQHIPYASISETTAAHTITAVSATKAWNLAGLNCSQVILSNDADQERWESLSLLKTHGATPFGIRASIAAYRDGSEWLDDVVSYLDGNRRLLAELLADRLPGIGYVAPEATYLGWLDCSDLELNTEPADFFLQHARVALSAGSPFGPNGRGHARFNFATSRPVIERAVAAMAGALKQRRITK